MTPKQEAALRLAREALEASKRTHHYCEDTWYSCPKHEDGCANESEGDECNCGADEANVQLDKAITAIDEALAEQPGEKEYKAFYDGKKWYSVEVEPPCKTGIQCTSKCEQCRYKYDCDRAAPQPEQKPIARLQWVNGWDVTLLTGAEDIPAKSGPYALYVGPSPEQPAQQQPDELTVWKARALQAEAVIAKFMEQPAPPPECQTEAEKTAFAFGWWKALEQKRKADSALDRMADNARELGLDYEPAQQQEPVAFPPVQFEKVAEGVEVGYDFLGGVDIRLGGEFVYVHINYDYRYTHNAARKALADQIVGLITTQPASKPWVGLSNDEIYGMYNEPRSDAEMVEFARALEAKLREKNAPQQSKEDA